MKNCFIEYQKTAENVTLTVCRVPLVKDCDSNEEQVSGTVVFPALNFQFNFLQVCSTLYESECVTQQEIHEVMDDIPNCQTVVEETCVDDTSGYATNVKCSKWPREECTLFKKQSTKYTPSTRCSKVVKVFSSYVKLILIDSCGVLWSSWMWLQSGPRGVP